MTKYILKNDLILNFSSYMANLYGDEKVLYIVDENVYNLYKSIFDVESSNVFLYVVNSGEESKNLDVVLSIYDFLVENNFNRYSYIVAVGGGVVGDLSGYVASTYMRGINLIHIPTTLLSMVDSSIGGKTAVNHSKYKNIIGSFYNAKYVIVDINFLKTLDDENFKQGISEIIKIAVLKDKKLFDFLSKNKLSIDSKELSDVIKRAQDLKISVVSKDALDRGERLSLNFGHTFGHAIESSSDLSVTHGIAVAKGMLIMSDLAYGNGLIDKDIYLEIKKAIDKQEIDTNFEVDMLKLISYIKKDKKVKNGVINFVIASDIGSYFIYEEKFENLENFVYMPYSKKIKFKDKLKPNDLDLPNSKSYNHRAILSAIALKKKVRVINPQACIDTFATKQFALDLGYSVSNDENYIVDGTKKNNKTKNKINCFESASTLRMAIPFSLLLENDITFYGKGSLVTRPLTSYIDFFDKNEVDYEYSEKLPITIKGKYDFDFIEIDGSLSSQFVSGMIYYMVSRGRGKIRINGEIASKDYIKMTIDTLNLLGVDIYMEKNDITVNGVNVCDSENVIDYKVEKDYSNSAFFIVYGILNDGITIKGLNENSLQADRKIIDICKSFGADLRFDKDVLYVKKSKLKGTSVDVSTCPDIAIPICLLASFSSGVSEITGIERLKIKESDRVKSTVDTLLKLGANISSTEKSIIIKGVETFKPVRVSSYNDHRIAMMLAVASSRVNGCVEILNSDCVEKSYKNFFKDLEKLGGIYSVQ